MTDFAYLESIGSGALVTLPSGEQKRVHLNETFSGINQGLTKVMDAWFGPDEVDAFDASCNTCRHFSRRPMTGPEKAARNVFGMPGQCLKLNVPTVAWQRGQTCVFENGRCYENRRTGRTHAAALVSIEKLANKQGAAR